MNLSNQISGLGTVMGVWAHPDDEIFSMAGVYALASRAGQKTICITATRGEHGVQDESRWPQAELADIRTKEMIKAVRVLGIDHHHWLDYSDGGCASVDTDEAAGRIAAYINQYQPDSLFTFGPDGLTGHDDHKTVSDWVNRAVELSDLNPDIYQIVMTKEAYTHLTQADQELNMFFNTENPCICSNGDCSLLVELDDDSLDKKIAALASMPSQTERLLKDHLDAVRLSGRVECFMQAKRL